MGQSSPPEPGKSLAQVRQPNWVTVRASKDRLGHASATETLDTYSHLWPDSEDLTRTAVDKVLGVAAADSLRTGESN